MLCGNPHYDVSSPTHDSKEISGHGSSIARQLSFKRKESQLGDNSISTSPSKPNFVVMNVMKNGATSLEEQVVSLIKTAESLTISFKERDDQMAFIMKRILDLIGKRPTNEEVSHENLQEEVVEQ